MKVDDAIANSKKVVIDLVYDAEVNDVESK